MAASPEVPLASKSSREGFPIVAVLIVALMVATWTFQTDPALGKTDACNGLRILMVYADDPPSRLRTELLARPNVSTVALFNGNTSTPTAGIMSAYDLVVAISDASWMDSVALGNTLANYLDDKGTVVPLNFSFVDSAERGIQGRYRTEGYSPFLYNAPLNSSNATLGSFNAEHPLMNGVNSLSAFYRQDVNLRHGATQVAVWSDGSNLIASKGRVIGINFHPQEAEPTTWTGDFARVIENAGKWKSVGCPTRTTLKLQKKSASKIHATGKVSPNHRGERVNVRLQIKEEGGGFGRVAGRGSLLDERSRYSTKFDLRRYFLEVHPTKCRIVVRFGVHSTHHPIHLKSKVQKVVPCSYQP